jgi:polyisoprenoid-binding protein YceI
MNMSKWRIWAVLVSVVALPLLSGAQTEYRIKSHEITMDGTSNLMSWSAEVEQAKGTFRIRVSDGKITDVLSANLTVEAKSIKGSEGKSMDSKIYEALDTRRHPHIAFVLREVISLYENPGTFRLSTRGVLTVSGVSRNIQLDTVGKILSNGDLEFTGSTKINMTDHDIKPPTAMFGLLRTGEVIDLKYKIILSPQ